MCSDRNPVDFFIGHLYQCKNSSYSQRTFAHSYPKESTVKDRVAELKGLISAAVHIHVHPEFESPERRKESFVLCNWDENQPMESDRLVDAGFFKADYGWSVCCFSCDVRLAYFEDEDPFEEHALMTRDCAFLREKQGNEWFIKTKARLIEERFPDGLPANFYPPPTSVPLDDLPGPMKTSWIPDNKPATFTPSVDDENKTEKELVDENRDLKYNMFCKVCKKMPSQYVVEPCGHFAYCDNCLKKQSFCAVCQGPIRKTTRVYLA